MPPAQKTRRLAATLLVMDDESTGNIAQTEVKGSIVTRYSARTIDTNSRAAVASGGAVFLREKW